jgi:hypothetical protein
MGLLWRPTWERANRLHDKYVSRDHQLGISLCASYEQLYCPYWGCVVWATWQRKGATALLQKGEATSNCALALVTL